MKYRSIEHTADAGIESYGDTLGELFENSALGMMSMMLDPGSVEPREEVEIDLAGEDTEELLFEWLNHLLFLIETKGLAFGDFRLEIDGNRLRGSALGERLDRERHSLGTQIKAATYHGMKVERRNSGWQARVIFDL